MLVQILGYLQTCHLKCFYFPPRSQIYNPGVPWYHHLDHGGSPSGSDTFWTEVLWHWLNRGQPEEHDLQFVLSIFCLVYLNVSHVLLVVPNTPKFLNWYKTINLINWLYLLLGVFFAVHTHAYERKQHWNICRVQLGSFYFACYNNWWKIKNLYLLKDRTANETASVLLVVSRCLEREAPQSHTPKTVQTGPYCMCSSNIELLSANWI